MWGRLEQRNWMPKKKVKKITDTSPGLNTTTALKDIFPLWIMGVLTGERLCSSSASVALMGLRQTEHLQLAVSNARAKRAHALHRGVRTDERSRSAGKATKQRALPVPWSGQGAPTPHEWAGKVPSTEQTCADQADGRWTSLETAKCFQPSWNPGGSPSRGGRGGPAANSQLAPWFGSLVEPHKALRQPGSRFTPEKPTSPRTELCCLVPEGQLTPDQRGTSSSSERRRQLPTLEMPLGSAQAVGCSLPIAWWVPGACTHFAPLPYLLQGCGEQPDLSSPSHLAETPLSLKKAAFGQEPPPAEINAQSSAKRQVLDCHRGSLLLLLLEKATTMSDPVGPRAMETNPSKWKKPPHKVLWRFCSLLLSWFPLKHPL